MHGQLIEIGCIPPILPDPKWDFLLSNGWYRLPKELSGIVTSSMEEFIKAIKGKNLGYGERFIGGFISGPMIKLGIQVVGYIPHQGVLRFNGDHYREFKIGYQCEGCHKRITGVPRMEVDEKNISLTLICRNAGCHARLNELGLDSLYYSQNPEELDD